jgi:hypothetical protein
MTKNTLSIIFLALGTLLQVNPAPMHAFRLDSGGLIPAPIPAGIAPLPTIEMADLDRNGIQESLAMTGGILTIHSAKKIAWQSPPGWNIVQAAIADPNNDGHPELVLLLWRLFLPWPVDQWLPHGGRLADFHDANGLSCHIILIGWKNNGYQELWAGSAMAEPVTAFAVADLDGDNSQELVALEGNYKDPRSAPAQILKVWKWNGFGFSVVSSMTGKFYRMTLVQDNNGHVSILVP